jgi:hypothetical protein
VEWTVATVEALAPDGASVAAARKLARPAPWSETGFDDRAVWGLCRGSGARPYEVAFDTQGPAFTCSCPSRKIPCKHALALLMRRVDGGVGAGAPPARVTQWLEGRAKRAVREPGEPVRDPEAAAKRAAEREARVAGGVEDLRLWLRDAVRGGLGAPRLRGWDEWDAFAARMVDAQAPGAASRLRSLGNVAALRPDGWPERLLSGLGMLHLLCEAYGRAPDGPLRDEVRTLLGFNAAKEEVLGGPRVQDEWAVLARVVIEQERLRVQRTWLWGHDHERAALLLDFAPPGAPLPARPPAGSSFDAGLAFYPGATPLRALLDTTGPLREAPGFFGVGGVGAALAACADAVAANPWLDEHPIALARAVADTDVVSAEDGSLPLRGTMRARWRLLALSAGRPVSVFGLWNGEALTPLAVGDGERTVAL